MNKYKIIRSLLALIFTTITIGALTLLTYKTNFVLFLISSFGSSYNTQSTFIFSPNIYVLKSLYRYFLKKV